MEKTTGLQEEEDGLTFNRTARNRQRDKREAREWEKQGGREDQIDRSNYLDGFRHAWNIANRVHNKGAKNTEQLLQPDKS